VAEAITRRSRAGKRFSIVAVSEGAVSKDDLEALEEAKVEKRKAKKEGNKKKKQAVQARLAEIKAGLDEGTMRLARQLEEMTNLESRVTILGHVQRGGTPSAFDRLLATILGTACAARIDEGRYGVMIAVRGQETEAVPLEQVAGKRKTVPLDHPWVKSARRVGICLGD
jgi:6-phosphofructokinase